MSEREAAEVGTMGTADQRYRGREREGPKCSSSCGLRGGDGDAMR